MIMDLEKLIKKYDLNIPGVIHIGAYTGGEYEIYKKLGIGNMQFFEPLPEAYEELKKRVGENRAINAALGNFNGKAKMYIASNGQSSTLLEPHLHKNQYPDIKFDREIEVAVVRLDDYLFGWDDFNFINIDVEGYELEVFKGATETLKNIDYIMSEVATVELQKGRVLVGELDEYLKDFLRVDTEWAGGTWGDALYIRR